MKIDLDRIREKLSYVDAVPLLSLLGILVGIGAGMATLLFRLVIEGILSGALPENSEDFEGLSTPIQAALPITGALLLGAAFQFLKPEERRTGVGYVIERFHLYQGVLTLRSFLIQFFGAAATLLCGFPMGREGPAVHLGAASGSLLGKWARLPNNSLRILTSCGCAAAISASFNTPIAGVIFAIEVVMMEYNLNSVIPIILSSVVGAILSRAVYGHEPAFIIPETHLGSLYELPFVLVCGIVTGTLAASTIFLARQCAARSKNVSVSWRFFMAGLVTAACGSLAPEILGIGYDTVNAAMLGQLSATSFLIILALKLIATSACVGLGLPAGVIGPALVLGALTGGLLGNLWVGILPGDANLTLYVLLGMVGMMAALMEAPLAALMALLELTFEAQIIFPGMLVVVTASLVCSQVFKQPGIFSAMLTYQGINLKVNPLSAHLHRVGVAAVMDRNFKRTKSNLSLEEANEILKAQPHWLLIESDGLPTHYMPAAELASFIETKKKEDPALELINLFEIPSTRDNLEAILLSATLQEALEVMINKKVNAVYVRRISAPNIYRVFGLVRKQDIEYYYQH